MLTDLIKVIKLITVIITLPLSAAMMITIMGALTIALLAGFVINCWDLNKWPWQSWDDFFKAL